MFPKIVAEYQRRVRRGIKWLNKEKPGWEKKIKLGTLDLSTGEKCVTGQLFKSFWDFQNIYAAKGMDSDAKCEQFGFYIDVPIRELAGADEDQNFSAMEEEYELLSAIWYYEIAALRENKL